jgi:hypothetical protein
MEIRFGFSIYRIGDFYVERQASNVSCFALGRDEDEVEVYLGKIRIFYARSKGVLSTGKQR